MPSMQERGEDTEYQKQIFTEDLWRNLKPLILKDKEFLQAIREKVLLLNPTDQEILDSLKEHSI